MGVILFCEQAAPMLHYNGGGLVKKKSVWDHTQHKVKVLPWIAPNQLQSRVR